MENQHRQIRGYRELNQAEIDLMNEIKAEGERLAALLSKQEMADLEGLGLTESGDSPDDSAARDASRWRAIAKTHFQQGLMALTRAVAKPSFF